MLLGLCVQTVRRCSYGKRNETKPKASLVYRGTFRYIYINYYPSFPSHIRFIFVVIPSFHSSFLLFPFFILFFPELFLTFILSVVVGMKRKIHSSKK
jgi:hypothetical protein